MRYVVEWPESIKWFWTKSAAIRVAEADGASRVLRIRRKTVVVWEAR